GQSYITSPFTF
nr:immunoglobulin light chain junction region [Macaca mulatta]